MSKCFILSLFFLLLRIVICGNSLYSKLGNDIFTIIKNDFGHFVRRNYYFSSCRVSKTIKSCPPLIKIVKYPILGNVHYSFIHTVLCKQIYFRAFFKKYNKLTDLSNSKIRNVSFKQIHNELRTINIWIV